MYVAIERLYPGLGTAQRHVPYSRYTTVQRVYLARERLQASVGNGLRATGGTLYTAHHQTNRLGRRCNGPVLGTPTKGYGRARLPSKPRGEQIFSVDGVHTENAVRKAPNSNPKSLACPRKHRHATGPFSYVSTDRASR